MSTNYYDAGRLADRDNYDPEVHIGKTYAGNGGVSFMWAMEVGQLEGITQIINEIGETFTRAEFTDVLAHCVHQDFDNVGVWFS